MAFSLLPSTILYSSDVLNCFEWTRQSPFCTGSCRFTP
nr:MAG TPA: hypothetical protein [Caudoviricetes sp.]